MKIMTPNELAEIVNRFITQIKKEYDIIGITLCGSYARGQWKPGSDIDISFLVRTQASSVIGQFSRKFEGVTFDYGIDTSESLINLLLNEPDLNYRKMLAHSLSTDSKIIYDPFSEAARIKKLAKEMREKFQVRYEKRG